MCVICSISKKKLVNLCVCGHPQAKHLYDGYGGCNEFKCVCDRFVHAEHSLENANAVDFNSSAASKDGGFLERLG